MKWDAKEYDQSDRYVWQAAAGLEAGSRAMLFRYGNWTADYRRLRIVAYKRGN